MSTMIDELDSDYETFHHDEVSLYCRQRYCEFIDTLISNLVDRFDQMTISLLSDVEEFFIFGLKSPSSVSSEEFEVKLNSRGMKHFSTDVELGKLKSEFTNLHLRFKNRSKITIFDATLNFFEDVMKCEFNW